jgi:methyl-accepting chemotaxis protein
VYIIKKSMQYRFVFWTVGAVLLAGGIVLADVLISLHRHAIERGLTIQVGDLYDPADPLTLVKLALYVFGVLAASLLLSHRVAGPIYRFERSAEQVSAGDLTSRVFLRQGDELVDLRDSFNGMVDTLRGKVAGDVACVQRARLQLQAILDGEGVAGENLEKLRRAMSELDRVGKGFRI